MDQDMLRDLTASLDRFIAWLHKHGEISYDHQTFFAGALGSRAKALYYKSPLIGTVAVAPMIFSEAFMPSARRLFWKPQRLPIADAHYAMGFAYLYKTFNRQQYYDEALHFLEVLQQTRCPDYEHYCWGYPFDWVTRNGTIAAGTPLITTTPYVYEAFLSVYQIDNDTKWLDVIRSIAEHAVADLKDFEAGPDASSCAYSPLPDDQGGVINASAYRAAMLTSAGMIFKKERYRIIAEKNLNFVLQQQQPNGSWLYAADSVRDFIDHFHTCFVLKALAKIEQLTGHRGCRDAIAKGVQYYLQNLFDESGLPKPFSRPPRLTVYRHELYDYAECINLCALLKGRFKDVDEQLAVVLSDLLTRWQKPDGSFRSRKLLLGWDNVPMHRWAQSQIFRSISFFLYNEQQKIQN